MLPFDIDRVHIDVGKHFRNTRMRTWGWDHYDLRDAIREAYRVSRAGRGEWELFVRKQGHKKLVIAYEVRTDEVFVITGAEG